MFGYYVRLGLRQLRRSPVLTLLVILTLAVGVAASMSTLTVLYMMSADPIPQKSDRLLTLTLDNSPLDNGPADDQLPRGLSWIDVKALREDGRGLRRSGMYGTGGIVEPQASGLKNFVAQGLAVDRDFFAMMDTSFKQGAAWSADEDRNEARVAVINQTMAEKLYGNQSAIGRVIRFSGGDFRIVGVLNHWHVQPRFYMSEHGGRTSGASLTDEEEIFLPLSTSIATEQSINGSVNCQSNADPGFKGLIASECTFLHYWVELPNAADRQEYREYLNHYIAQQKARGRLPRPDRSGLYNVREWLTLIGIVDDDTRLQTWLAFGFLSVCLVNTIGLLLAKFTARSGEIGVRRALGASRAQIFAQYLLEAATLGLVGSVLGVVLAYAMLYLMAYQSPDLAALAKMDSLMLATTVLLSVAAAVIAGLLPTWRATQVVPALQLKSQ